MSSLMVKIDEGNKQLIPVLFSLTYFSIFSQELIVSRGKTLELMRPDPNTGKVSGWII